MPLPNILSGKTKRCKSKSKTRGEQCRNPAAYGMAVCRYHGARKPETIMRGANHPHYKNGQETLAAKAGRSQRLAELRNLEALSFSLGLAVGSKWRGRKPRVAPQNDQHYNAEPDPIIRCDVEQG